MNPEVISLLEWLGTGVATLLFGILVIFAVESIADAVKKR